MTMNDAVTLSGFERYLREREARAGIAAATSDALPWQKLKTARLCLARLGGEPMRDVPRAELGGRLNDQIAELRGAVAAVGWERGIEVWGAMVPETAAAVREQHRYLDALERAVAA
jgi:hypothetical protein